VEVVALTFSALTSTGITAPVFRLKVRCPRTRRIDEISPEWLVTLTKESSLLLVAKKTSPSAVAERTSCAALVSADTPFQSSSSSTKPLSMRQEGKRFLM
jgi:hypothetical protein